ncbi:MAG: glycosyltransferase family 4 protein [Candidatus Bathyarchaeia archaeon]
MIKVLMGLGYYEIGGFKTVIDNLGKYLPRYGVEVTVAARVVRVEPPNHVNLIKLTPEEFLREARHFDVIHIHTSYPYTKAAVEEGLKNIVFTWHGYTPSIYVPGLKNKIINFLLKHSYRTLLPRIKYVTAVSQYAAKQLRDFYRLHRVSVIPNGIDSDIFKPCRRCKASDKLVFLNVTAWNRLKGSDLLIKYFKVIRRKFPNAILITRRLDRRYHLEGVIAMSEVSYSEMPNLYCSSDIYLLTSRWESFGLPIIEAFATGTPVIALDRDDARREHIINSGAGALFRDAESLLRAIDEVLRDWQEYSRRGINYAQRFSCDFMARGYVGLYREVLNGEDIKR